MSSSSHSPVGRGSAMALSAPDTARLLLLRGSVAVAFGLIALIWPGVTLLVIAVVFGIYAIVDGIGWIAAAFRPGDRFQRGTHALVGVLGLLAGIGALVWPQLTVLALAVVVGIWAVATGIIEIIAAFRRGRARGTVLLGLAGALSVLAGALILLQPFAGALGVAVIIGGYAVVYGAVLVFVGFRLRRLVRGVPERAA